MVNNYKEIFNDKKKIEIFDKISQNYFDKNFGSMSKVNFETLLFSEYIETVIENNLPFDDYTLSKQLGITQNKIRTLKERKELQYPYKNFDWKLAFAKCVENAKYDSDDKYIKMIIEDVNVMKEIRNYIEKYGWYDETTLNKKMLKIRLDCFVFICVNNADFEKEFAKTTKENIKKLKYKDGDISRLMNDFSFENLKEYIHQSEVTSKMIAGVLNCIQVPSPFDTILSNLSKIVEKA